MNIANRYNEGKGALGQVIESESKDMYATSYAGSYVNDTIRDMAALKKLVSCKD